MKICIIEMYRSALYLPQFLKNKILFVLLTCDNAATVKTDRSLWLGASLCYGYFVLAASPCD